MAIIRVTERLGEATARPIIAAFRVCLANGFKGVNSLV